jgi:hypothetical protein
MNFFKAKLLKNSDLSSISAGIKDTDNYAESLKQIIFDIPQGYLSVLMLNGIVITLAYFLVWKKFKKKMQYVGQKLKK